MDFRMNIYGLGTCRETQVSVYCRLREKEYGYIQHGFFLRKQLNFEDLVDYKRFIRDSS